MLAQAAYGTELQVVLPGELRRLRAAGLQVMALFPLHLAGVRAPGLVDNGGWDNTVRDPYGAGTAAVQPTSRLDIGSNECWGR